MERGFRLLSAGIIGGLLLGSVNAAAQSKKVCVDIALQRLQTKESQHAKSEKPVQHEVASSETSSVTAPVPPKEPPPETSDEENPEGAAPVDKSEKPTPFEGQVGPPPPNPAPTSDAPSDSWDSYRAPESAPTVDKRSRRGRGLPSLETGRKSLVYLKRLMEYYVTHQDGYVAVENGCDETIRVELYPLAEGWTVFVRYTGTNREERVDVLYSDELSQFAERAVLAVLNDVSISETINRENVLRADSMKSVQRIRGTNHFVMSVGTQLRGGMMPSAIDDSSRSDVGQTEKRVRVVTPFTTSLGYRGRFEAWGLEAMAMLGIGTNKIAVRKNPEGGHIDFGGDAGFGIHFLRYFDPRGLISFYMGAGSTFELLWFSAIKPVENRGKKNRSYLLGGGLDVDAVLGWEFMRASAVQFLLQGELNLPAYAVRSENNDGALNTWFPGLSVKLGIIF